MANPTWPAQAARKIAKRIVVHGDLVLESPAHLGSGESSDISDMPLLTAPDDDKTPLLTGASIAGALRAYLRSREVGGFQAYGAQDRDERKSLAVCLFGGSRMDDDGEQSPLIVEDAYGQTTGIELRAGVRISPESRTAADNLLYNAQYWQAGTTFPLQFELLLRETDDQEKMLRAFAAALQGFERGEIALGARKQRGFGQCRVSAWQVEPYDLSKPQDLLGWLEEKPVNQGAGPHIADLLGVDSAALVDQRSHFTLKGRFALDGSMLIRSSTGKLDGPDTVHLHSRRVGQKDPRPVLSGTSLGGALRARAAVIARTLELKDPAVFIDKMFGPELVKGQSTDPKASRLRAAESVIEHTPETVADELVQNRVKIDRFTGGAFPTALFAEQPVFAQQLDGQETAMTITLTLQEPQEGQIGMLLLLLKDLWTGDLALGGESSVGRGRLKGVSAELTRKQPGKDDQIWKFIQGKGDALVFQQGEASTLEGFIQELLQEVGA